MRVENKKAIVTGAGQGIGKAIALMLAKNGADVCIADKNAETLQGTLKELQAIGRKALAVTIDVTDFASVTAMAQKTKETLGGIDILVNTVGWDIIEPFWKNAPEYWDKVIDINYKSVIYCTRAVLDTMMEQNFGKIINIASDAGRGGSSGESVYAGAKGGVIAFTKSIAREVARYKISVNCVCPGPTDTPLFRGQPEKMQEALEKAIPFRRVAAPEDIAGAALYFASDISNYVTGQVFSVSGGLTMHG